MRKKSLTLLELLLSLSLVTVIVGILIASYKDLCLAKKISKTSREKILGELKLQLRLKQIFSSATSFEDEGNGRFAVQYNNGVDADDNFRGERKGMFYVDTYQDAGGKKQGRFVFATWPEAGPPRLEILLQGVSKVEFLFFDPVKKDWDSVYPEKLFMMKVKFPETMIPIFL